MSIRLALSDDEARDLYNAITVHVSQLQKDVAKHGDTNAEKTCVRLLGIQSRLMTQGAKA